MKIKIQSPTIRKNVEAFKELARSFLHKKLSVQPIYHEAFVHKDKGDLSFDEKSSKEWQKVRVVFAMGENSPERMRFSLMEEDLQALSAKAENAVKETMTMLNALSQQMPEVADMKRAFTVLSQIEIEGNRFQIKGKDLIHEAWHQVSREEAENLLTGKEEGTFFFRKDSYAAMLEESLGEALHVPIKCITLTILGHKEQVMEHTLINKAGLWLVYDDDLTLSGVSYPSIYALLESLEDLLKKPLLV